jgi:hypothetical protein
MEAFTGALTYVVLKSSIWKDQCALDGLPNKDLVLGHS